MFSLKYEQAPSGGTFIRQIVVENVHCTGTFDVLYYEIISLLFFGCYNRPPERLKTTQGWKVPLE